MVLALPQPHGQVENASASSAPSAGGSPNPDGEVSLETGHLFRRPPANSKTPLRLCASARGSPVPDGEGSLNSHHHTPGIREIPYQNAPVLTKQVRIRHALGILRSKPTHNPGQ